MLGRLIRFFCRCQRGCVRVCVRAFVCARVHACACAHVSVYVLACARACVCACVCACVRSCLLGTTQGFICWFLSQSLDLCFCLSKCSHCVLISLNPCCFCIAPVYVPGSWRWRSVRQNRGHHELQHAQKWAFSAMYLQLPVHMDTCTDTYMHTATDARMFARTDARTLACMPRMHASHISAYTHCTDTHAHMQARTHTNPRTH